jgi:hypothetical protein
MPGGHPLPTTDAHDLAELLDPAIHEAADGRLGPISWFRSTHQRGGSATGYSTWRFPDGADSPVLVKLPVGPVEHRWTCGLGRVEPDHWHDRWALSLPTPRVIAAGDSLGGYEVAWIVTERLTPAGQGDAGLVEDLLRAAADFHAAAMKIAPLEPKPPAPDWEKAIERSRAIARGDGIPEAHRWSDVLRRVSRTLPILRHRWESRPINAWCHGDLHPGNVLRRALPDEVPDPDLVNRHGCVLIDLALVHPGHWIEDALYVERQYWSRPDVLGALKPVPMLARLRRERGLPTDEHYGELAMVRRVLTGACAPALLDREGNPAYLHAALETVERYLPQVSKL